MQSRDLKSGLFGSGLRTMPMSWREGSWRAVRRLSSALNIPQVRQPDFLIEPQVPMGVLLSTCSGPWPLCSPGLILMSVCGKACAERRVTVAKAHSSHPCILGCKKSNSRPEWRKETLPHDLWSGCSLLSYVQAGTSKSSGATG